GPMVLCTYCRCEFQQENKKSNICPRCNNNKTKYGNPRACEYCNIIAAFIGSKCQKCANSIKKYGPPIRCSQCKLKCAFNRPGTDKSRVLCLMCMMSRKRSKDKAGAYGYKVKSSDHEKSAGHSEEVKGNNASVNSDLTSTPSGTGKKTFNQNISGRSVKNKSGYLQKIEQDIEYKEDGTTDLIGGWAKYRKRSLGPTQSISPFETPTKITPSRSVQRNFEGMSPGEQIVMVLNLQAKIANLTSTLSAKDNQLQEKEASWDRLMTEERDRIYQSEDKLRKEIEDKTTNLRETVNALKEKLTAATTELATIKARGKSGDNTNTATDSAAGASDDSDKDEQDNKREKSRSESPMYRDEMDDKNSDNESEKDKNFEKESDNEYNDDKNMAKHSKRKSIMIVSDTDDEDANHNENVESDEKDEIQTKNQGENSSEFTKDDSEKNDQDVLDDEMKVENNEQLIEGHKSVENEKVDNISEDNQNIKENENKSEDDISDEEDIQLGKNKSKNNIYSDSE
ncbi:unnamed protein product, partial [Meganyctiphanes norvegica]